MRDLLHRFVSDQCGQDIAEYAVMFALMLVLVFGILVSVGVNSNQVFFQVASAIR